MPESQPMHGLLREENRHVLSALAPALAARLRDRQDTLTRAITIDGRVVDIDLGESRLYGRPADAFAAEQVDTFLARPDRLLVNRPDADKLMDPFSAELVRGLAAHCGDTDLLDAPAAGRGGVLFVVGIGLGAHLERLVTATAPRRVVLVEPIVEFLAHSLDAVDWQALRAACDAHGAALDIVAEDTPAACMTRLEAVMAGIGESLLDGSHLFVHYNTPATRDIARQIHRFAGMRAILKGYFDDERLMVENMTANVTARDFRMLDGSVRPPVNVPAIVVGSGPSLDASVDAIRRCRDHAVVITAGSALQALLHHGIVPDWHVEKENSAASAARLRLILESNRDRFPDGRFSGIRLIASTTVDAGVVDLFDDVCLFLRTSLSSTAMFGSGHVALDGTSPYSANAAMTVAAILGFREMFLFGCDCGARRGSGHHSQNTVYYAKPESAEARDYARRTSNAAGRFDFPLTAPANFGGEVDTNSYFLWSARTYAQVIAALGMRVYNCSDGIAIDGAEPLPPDALTPDDGAPLDRAALSTYLDEQSVWYPAGGYLDGQDVAATLDGWRDFADACRATLDRLDAEAHDIHAYLDGMSAFLDAAEARWGGPVVLAGGTLRAQPALAAWWLGRAPDDGTQEAWFAWFRTGYRDIAERVLDGGDEVMALVAERAALPDILGAVMQQKA